MKKHKISILLVAAILLTLGLAACTSEIESEVEREEPRTVSIIEQPEEYGGERGEKMELVNGEIKIDVSGFDDNIARFYNTELPAGKTIYFFVVQDKEGVHRAAGNECQVCYAVKMGFRQEGDEMVCNNCQNRYPIERIATEKGGCNPAPINPNLIVSNNQITITQGELEQISDLF